MFARPARRAPRRSVFWGLQAFSATLLLAAAVSLDTCAALAQAASTIHTTDQPVEKAQAAPSKASAIPPPDVLVMLIRTTLIALNQANETGNYAVLFGLAGPALRQGSSPEALALALAGLREKGINLSPMAIVSPELTEPPTISKDGLLRLTGLFPTRPFAIRFSLAFGLTEQGWRMEGLNVDATPASTGETAKARADFDAKRFLPKPSAPKPQKRAGKPPKAAPTLDPSTDPPTTTSY